MQSVVPVQAAEVAPTLLEAEVVLLAIEVDAEGSIVAVEGAEEGAVVGSLPESKEGMLLFKISTTATDVPGRVFSPGGPSDIDSRLRDNTQDTIVASLKSLSLQDKDLPVRPDFGKIGTPIKLRANFFPVKVPKEPLYEYDVTITPAAGTAARRVKRRIFQLAEQTSDWTRGGLKGLVAHDHASKLIAAKELPQPLIVK